MHLSGKIVWRKTTIHWLLLCVLCYVKSFTKVITFYLTIPCEVNSFAFWKGILCSQKALALLKRGRGYFQVKEKDGLSKITGIFIWKERKKIEHIYSRPSLSGDRFPWVSVSKSQGLTKLGSWQSLRDLCVTNSLVLFSMRVPAPPCISCLFLLLLVFTFLC